MQVRAIIEAAIEVSVTPEIMIPLVATQAEFKLMKALADKTAEAVFAEKKKRVSYTVGTMIELPRAALIADKIAEDAAFFSFGTNDLTQTTLGLSRDDAAHFLPDYLRQGIFERDPFATLDTEGVGQLIGIGVERGRMTNKSLKAGICGEHGGDPASIAFCQGVGLDYVSCSPYRVPIARLAAAQAAIRLKTLNGTPQKKEAA
jgi:pyruvate,orthophosphate dikinase